MNSKPIPRGVQEADVWAAADALIAQGLRPTIERVRQHIGRGSPNTVSPMLEGWFATLGQRLGVADASKANGAADAAVPQQVSDIAKALWESAHEQALAVATAQLQEREAALNAVDADLAARGQALEQRETTMQIQKEAMDQALKLAQSQSEALTRQLNEMQQQLQEREQRIEQLREALAEAALQRESLQQKHAEDLQAAAGERQRMAEQYAGNERHMLNELDRSRQELAQARKQATEQERRAEARHQELQARYERSEEEGIALHARLREAEAAALLAQERALDFKQLLQAQQQSGAAAAADPAAASRKATLASARRSMLRLRDRRAGR